VLSILAAGAVSTNNPRKRKKEKGVATRPLRTTPSVAMATSQPEKERKKKRRVPLPQLLVRKDASSVPGKKKERDLSTPRQLKPHVPGEKRETTRSRERDRCGD